MGEGSVLAGEGCVPRPQGFGSCTRDVDLRK